MTESIDTSAWLDNDPKGIADAWCPPRPGRHTQRADGGLDEAEALQLTPA